MAKYHYRKYRKSKPKNVIEEDPYLYEIIVVPQEEGQYTLEFVHEDDVVNRLLRRTSLSVIQSFFLSKRQRN